METLVICIAIFVLGGFMLNELVNAASDLSGHDLGYLWLPGIVAIILFYAVGCPYLADRAADRQQEFTDKENEARGQIRRAAAAEDAAAAKAAEAAEAAKAAEVRERIDRDIASDRALAADAALAAAKEAEATRAVIAANRSTIWALGWEQGLQVQDIGKFKFVHADNILLNFGKPDSAKPYGEGGAWTYTGLRGTDKTTYASPATVFQPDSSSSVTFILMKGRVTMVRFKAP